MKRIGYPPLCNEDFMKFENDNSLNEADRILSGIVAEMDPREKTAVILEIVPIEIFDEIFRNLEDEDQVKIIEILDEDRDVNSLDTSMTLREFITKSDIGCLLEDDSVEIDDTIDSFIDFAVKNPVRIARLLNEIWLQ